ncbi:MAG: hypothetical protein EOP84_29065 [Verrucomicrobiaceae bacterium]|nr:MAG: hypothetical protein EOP84_29065 [Verrucomicrobiaceae bacterium]
MSNPSSDPDSSAIAAARAVRFGFAAIVLGMSYPNIRCALGIRGFEQIYSDMLGGKALPAITTFVLWAHPFLAALSILIPVTAVALIFFGRLSRSIYISGALILIVFLQLFFTWQAVSAPLFEIIRSMHGATP